MSTPSDIRSLCQVLLNGSPGRETLQAAEDFVKAALGEARKQRGPPEVRLEAWQPVGTPDLADRGERRTLLLALSPALLLEGVWLARVSQPATGHLSAHGHLFAIYCRIVGLEDDSPALPLHFRNLLTCSGISLPPLYSPTFFNDRRIPNFALHMPCLQLGLMHRPRTFFPELLGYTLAHCFLDPAWWASLAREDATAWMSARERFAKDVRPMASAALASCLRERCDPERIGAGWLLYRHSLESLLAGVAAVRARHPTATEIMADIIRTKRPYAVGYHHRVMLQGQSLDRWLAQAEDDPVPLLEALRNSPYTDLRCPAASRLIRAMDFGGPMFGVFTAEERQVCLGWIENPSAEVESLRANGAVHPPVSDRVANLHRPNSNGRSEKNISRTTVDYRKLFTALLNAESAEGCPPEATIAVERILRRSRWLERLKPPPRTLRHYDPIAFTQWVEGLYCREAGRYRPSNGNPRVGRDFCVWAALQLAPSILVDGCWLAAVPTASENLGEVERHLLQIYADEVGNGNPERNHANVYRRLLQSLSLTTPEFETEDFARDARFIDAAFEFPVYMLAIGLLKDRYFPELLGLNLAIELSGLGAGYMEAADILGHHGIDPTIVQLHQTIDNLACGHSARARDAILLYLDRIRQQGDVTAVQNAWRRIRLGHASFGAALLPLAGRFMQRYLADRLKTVNPMSRTVRKTEPSPSD
ncbi:iron-containing redox enzyme family protein [Methylocaldum szegediense]|uniref:iron-containing redox enzyme family protein n=1 Tax=Methylocaldum szegediense TaxID=73780 RepID=UPI0003FC1281|nr:iron-containing redox enzyme family protein [Methylocaldum szegediense]